MRTETWMRWGAALRRTSMHSGGANATYVTSPTDKHVLSGVSAIGIVISTKIVAEKCHQSVRCSLRSSQDKTRSGTDIWFVNLGAEKSTSKVSQNLKNLNKLSDFAYRMTCTRPRHMPPSLCPRRMAGERSGRQGFIMKPCPKLEVLMEEEPI